MPKCGNCKDSHATVDDVRDCYAQSQYDEEQAKAEALAEQRAERWWEERGGGEPDDPREVEAQMRDDELRAKAEYAAREEEQERLAYTQKMKRDEEMLAGTVLDRLQGEPSGFNPDPPSDKQVKYVMDLLGDREWPQSLDEADIRNMARRQVSKLIDGLKSSPKRKVEEKPLVIPEPGMYWALQPMRKEKDIVRVYHGQVAGRNLVKLIVQKGINDDESIKYGYKYIGSAERLAKGRTELGAVKLVEMTLEEAKEWGRMTRSCVVCGRRLDVPESVDAGIGPVCAGRMSA